MVFITQSYFQVPKDIKLNTTYLLNIKIPNIQELQQIAINNSKNGLQKIYYITIFITIVIDTALPSDNASRFWKNPLYRVQRVILTIDDKIRDEKLNCKINRVTAKIFALLSVEIDKHMHVTGEKIILWKHSIIEEAKFTYSPLGKALKNKQKQLRRMMKNKFRR